MEALLCLEYEEEPGPNEQGRPQLCYHPGSVLSVPVD